MIGQTLNNRYTILARLGRGAMGTVYRATDPQSGRDVAVKVISSELAIDPSMLERFKREGEALRQLKHINIVGFIDAFQHDEQAVIVMEHVEGGSLYDLIKKGPLPIEHAVQIALDLCDALISSHRLKIIHRDIKPENILIDNRGTSKLADFGVARLSEGTRMTRSGVQVGTPYYMSPEAWEGRTLDAQADIWSLGVVLFEMLTGQVPFTGETGPAVMQKVFTTQAPDLRKLRAEVPQGLVKIIRRMLTRDKKVRYQTMREVAVDLERALQATTHVDFAEKKIKRQAAWIDTLAKSLPRFLARNQVADRSILASYPKNIVFILALIFLLGVIGLAFYRQARSLPLFFTGVSNGEINIYSYRSQTITKITQAIDEGENWSPAPGSSGNLYFTSNRTGKAELYGFNTYSGKLWQITHTLGQAQSWAPVVRGLNLYFASDRSGISEIYVHAANNDVGVSGFESWTKEVTENSPESR